MGAVIFLFALPLLLFVVINLGIISEIKTFIISIPKLAVWWGNEIISIFCIEKW